MFHFEANRKNRFLCKAVLGIFIWYQVFLQQFSVLKDWHIYIVIRCALEECYFQQSCRLKACNYTKSNTPLWVFFTFFKLYKWYQIPQNIWQSLELLNVFVTLLSQQFFWKSKTFFKKLEHSLLVKSTSTESPIFP